MNTNKNSYTLIYMVIIIVIVSLLLSIVSGALKGRQAENVKLDTKKQILSSLPVVDLKAGDPAEIYKNTIVDYQMLDAEGNVVKSLNPVDDFGYEMADGELPLYVANVDGATKYIIPMRGAGLWGAIWGYIALDDDRNTVYGVYFSHAGETPGLGANIVEPSFRNPFVGKHILNAAGEFASIAVMKAGQIADGQDQVDAISGGTITSKGVEAMIKTSLEGYAKFFTAAKTAEVAEPEAVETVEETEVESENNGGEEL